MPHRDSWRYAAPNAFTFACLAMGFGSMCAAANGRFDFAVNLLFIGIILDMCDGRVARKLKATSELGQQLDSFSDTISFCVAPAFLVQRAMLNELEGFGVAISILFVMAGVYRLARFNLLSDAHGKATKTTGVPTPIAAGYLMAVTVMRDEFHPLQAAVVVLIFASLMVSRLKLPEVQWNGLLGAAFFVGFWSYVALLIWPSWLTFTWWNLWNIVLLLIARAQDRKLAEADA